LALFSLPLWLPGLQAAGSPQAAAPEGDAAELAGAESSELAVEPAAALPEHLRASAPPLLVLDYGEVNGGDTAQTIVSAPHVFVWEPAQSQAAWSSAIGFPLGAVYSEGTGLVYLTEQHQVDGEEIVGLTVEYSDLQPPSQEWPIFFTVLDASNGEIVDSRALPPSPGKGRDSQMLYPVAVQDQTLYLSNYQMRANLVAFDLVAGEFAPEAWSSCEHGYPAQIHFVEELGAVLSLCMDYSTGLKSLVTLTPLNGDAQRSIEFEPLGEEDYTTGNGLVLGPDGRAYLVDSDAGAIVEIDVDSMRVLRTAYYQEAVQPSGWIQHLHAWLLELAASPARAKRWLAEPAISPDGRSLAVDGGLSELGGATRSVWLVDLESLQASQEIELSGSPHTIRFASNEMLYVLLQNEGSSSSNDLVVYDLAGDQAYNFSFETRGWLSELMVLQ
jgi:hypothetical protein